MAPRPIRPIVFTTHDDVAGVADERALTQLAVRVLEGEGASPDALLSVYLADDETMRELNLRFLGIDAPTDVLAFPEGDALPGEPVCIGDIAIGVPVAARQAAELGHSLHEELAHLLVHGILHLHGYEHEGGGEAAARMRAREESYLGDITSHAEADASGA